MTKWAEVAKVKEEAAAQVAEAYRLVAQVHNLSTRSLPCRFIHAFSPVYLSIHLNYAQTLSSFY